MDREALSVTIDLLQEFERDPSSEQIQRNLCQQLENLAETEVVSLRELAQAAANLVEQIGQGTVEVEDDVVLLIKEAGSTLKDFYSQIGNVHSPRPDELDEILGRIDLAASGGYDFSDEESSIADGSRDTQNAIRQPWAPKTDDVDIGDSGASGVSALLVSKIVPLQKTISRRIQSMLGMFSSRDGNLSGAGMVQGSGWRGFVDAMEVQFEQLKKLQQELEVNEGELHLRAQLEGGVDRQRLIEELSRFVPASKVQLDHEGDFLNNTALYLCETINPPLRELSSCLTTEELELRFFEKDQEYIVALTVSGTSEEPILDTIRKHATEREVLEPTSVLDDKDLLQFAGLYFDSSTEEPENLRRLIASPCAVEVTSPEEKTWSVTFRISKDCFAQSVVVFDYQGEHYGLYRDEFFDFVSIGDPRVDSSWGEVKMAQGSFPIVNQEGSSGERNVVLLNDPSHVGVVVGKLHRPASIMNRPSANEFARPYGFTTTVNGSNVLVLAPDDLLHLIREEPVEVSDRSTSERIQVLGDSHGVGTSFASRLKEIGFDAICTHTVSETIASFQELRPALLAITSMDESKSVVKQLVAVHTTANTHLVLWGVQDEPATPEGAEWKTCNWVDNESAAIELADKLLVTGTDESEVQPEA